MLYSNQKVMIMPYIKTNLENIITIKKNVIFIGARIPTNDEKKFMGESHDFWELLYVIDGKFDVKCDDKHYIVNTNDVLFYKPFVFHHPKGAPPYPITEYVNISFECNSDAMKFFENYHGQLSPKTKKLMEDIIEEGRQNFIAVADGPIARSVTKSDAPIGGHQLYRLKLELFLITLLQEIQAQSSNKIFTSKNEFYRSLFNDVKSYMAENIYSDISIDDICKKFNYSRSFLSKLFKTNTGIPIMHHYKKLKIEEAKLLLKDTDHTVAYVAEILRFGNRYNFSKLFKSFTGVTPAEFKKKAESTQP